MIHLDTAFIVDLLREERRGTRGPARAQLEALESEAVGVSMFVVCELEVGVLASTRLDHERATVDALLGALQIAYPDDRFAGRYAQIVHGVQARGRTIATMDALIGVTAVVEHARLVTRNRRHFEMIPGLQIIGY